MKTSWVAFPPGSPSRSGSVVLSNKIKLNRIKKRLIFFKIANLRDSSSVFLKIPFFGGSFVSSLLLLALLTGGFPVFISLKDLKNRRAEAFKKE